MWGAEAQGTQQVLLWHKGAEGTPLWGASQAAGARGWVGWRRSSARGSVQGPRRLHSYLQKFSVTRGIWLNVSLCSLGWQLSCWSWQCRGHTQVSIRRHTLHPSSHHHLLDPRPLLPDTTVPPGEGQRSALSQKQLWQCLHTKREFRGDAGALEGSQKE